MSSLLLVIIIWPRGTLETVAAEKRGEKEKIKVTFLCLLCQSHRKCLPDSEVINYVHSIRDVCSLLRAYSTFITKVTTRQMQFLKYSIIKSLSPIYVFFFLMLVILIMYVSKSSLLLLRYIMPSRFMLPLCILIYIH